MIISCVKWGNKFSHEHVNRLYQMCKKNYTKPFTFVCHTENSNGLVPGISARPLNEDLDLEKWWWKLQLFDEHGWPEQKIDINIFFDLDVVIQNNFDHFDSYAVEDKLTMIKAYWKTYDLKGTDMDHNSSVMIWKGDLSYLWRKFYKDPERHLMKYGGIDGYLYHECRDYITTIPRGEVYSRLFGIDENRSFNYDVFKEYFYVPEYTVCIFNGWKRDVEDDRYLLDDDGYAGFEHYWESDKKWLNDNHTKIDRNLWHSMWECASEGGDVVHFLDSVSDNQWESKKWLVDMVTEIADFDPKKIQLFGGWFAHPMCTLLTNAFGNLEWIENTDVDDYALHVCRNLNNNLPCDLITTQKNVVEPGDRDRDTDLVINTSSEHMPPLPVLIHARDFRRKADRPSLGPTLFAIQSNNMFHIDGHINCVNSEDELATSSGFGEVIYKGHLDMPNGYKRFMVIGYA